MKVFLDDTRQAPDGWVRTYQVKESIELLKSGKVEIISLDYHLGGAGQGSGLDVLDWIERAVKRQNFDPPLMRVHSDHRKGRALMLAKIDAIQRIVQERKEP